MFLRVSTMHVFQLHTSPNRVCRRKNQNFIETKISNKKYCILINKLCALIATEFLFDNVQHACMHIGFLLLLPQIHSSLQPKAQLSHVNVFNEIDIKDVQRFTVCSVFRFRFDTHTKVFQFISTAFLLAGSHYFHYIEFSLFLK